MRDPISKKKHNQRRRYTYVKSREHATAVVNMGTRVEIVQMEREKIAVLTAKNMVTSLKTVTERRNLANNERTATRRVTNKRSSGRNKNMAKKNKRKRLTLLKRYITTRYFSVMTQSHAKIKQSTSK